jgi:anaerobic selenocysteine-containing dehydrogenase
MSSRRRVRTTCPRDCYDGCGIVVEFEGDGIHRVIGDPEHPVSRGALCGKCALAYNGAWRDPAVRLTEPLRRTGARASGDFEPVSWATALGEIAERLHGIVTAHGGASVIHAHYTGTCSLLAGEFPLRFFHRLGATEVEPDTVCNNAGHVALNYLYGTSTRGFDPRTADEADTIVVWGANPSACGPHVDRYWLGERRARLIVIDPVRTDTAEGADLHLQLRPGTDAVLAFAMMHVLRAEGLLDHDYIEAHTLGFDEIAPHVEACSPAHAATVTGIPESQIRDSALAYGRGRSMLWIGQGMQRQPRGGNAVRACAMLPALTGNLGRPGTGVLYLNGGESRRVDGGFLAGGWLAPSTPPEPISHMDLADALGDPRRARAFFCWNMNVAASGPRQRRLRQALSRDGLFNVVIDLFMTDTARLGDYVLPAASFLEFDDVVVPYFHHLLSAQVAVQPPPGQALSNMEIFRRLAAAMGYDEPDLQTPDRELIDRLLADSGVDFDTLAQAGSVALGDTPAQPFADGRFPTPSGRVELASARAEADGHPRTAVPEADPRPAPGHWRMLSPAGPWLMNDSYHNDPHIARTLGEVEVWIHPADAGVSGVGDGAPVRLRSSEGELGARALLTDRVPRGTLLMHKGRWPSLELQGANVNVLNPGESTDMGRSSAVHGTQVELVVESRGLDPGAR